MKIHFGDLPQDAQAMLTQHLRVDFTPCDFRAPRWFSGWARNDEGHITGIFAIEFPYWFEGRVTIMVLDPRCMSRRVLRAIFTAAFSQAKRLTAEVEPDNRRALQQVQRLGFVHEGYRPLGLEGTRDTIVFGMLKEECRYLPSYVPPSEPRLDVAHRHLADTVILGDGSLWTRVRPDRKDLGFSEFGIGPGLASSTGSFAEVSTSGRPAEVLGTDAAGSAAGVRGIHFARGHSIFSDADEAVDFASLSVVPHLRVAPLVDGKRPEKTVVSSVDERGGKSGFRGHNPALTKV